MIDRYADHDISRIWSDDRKYLVYLDILIAWADVRMDMAHSLRDLAKSLADGRCRAFHREVAERERITRHDVAAFIDVVAARCGVPVDRFLAYGMTSSDLVDTHLFWSISKSAEEVRERVDILMSRVAALARKHALTVCAGRTHGQLADLTTFGFRMAQFYHDLAQVRSRICADSEQYGMISGPVGIGTHTPEPRVTEALVGLGITPYPITSQVISRVPIAAIGSSLSLLSAVLAKWATNLRLLLQWGVGELILTKGSEEKGSSSMPHKTNPADLEKVCGLYRLAAGYARALEDDILLWQERDISHSSVERVALPDLFHILCVQIASVVFALDRIIVNDGQMRVTAEACPASFRDAHLLVDGPEVLTRDQAYERSRNSEPYRREGVDQWLIDHGDGIARRIHGIVNHEIVNPRPLPPLPPLLRYKCQTP